MPALPGTLTGPPHTDWTGYRIVASYGVQVDDVKVEGSVATTTPNDGSFAFTLPDGYVGPVSVRASAPNGVEVATASLPAGAPLPVHLDLPATPVPGIVVAPTDDPTGGRIVRLVGRVLDPTGAGSQAGLLVLLWGRPDGTPAVPVVAAQTTDGGYFADDWPTDAYVSAFGTVGPSDAIPVPLQTDGRFPRTVVLVTPTTIEMPPAAGTADSECDCDTATPPRNPGQAELTQDSAAFSSDLGAGRCVDLTVPNRTVEELRFHAVVRTTEPQIKGVTLPSVTGLPPHLVQQLQQLAEPMAKRDAVRRAPKLMLDAATVTDQLRTGLGASSPTVDVLQRADTLSRLKMIGELVTAVGPAVAGRFVPDADHRSAWDDHPEIYQATTVAVGHLLTMKQVWRADGYSLGDLLYSLPLAPGQTKQIATLDWDRRETAVRQASRAEAEQLAASLSHDRDVSEIIYSSLAEHDHGSSSASVQAVGGGIAGFIGPVIFGGGGGESSAHSEAHAYNARDVASSMLNQAQDRTSQAANSVRSQRVTTVQSARQGESLTVQTEVVSNHNHCHAVTMEYFEVLRHFQVSVETADVQECLFVPLALDAFTPAKALRWRDSLNSALSRTDLAGGFDAIARMLTNWADADVPLGRYADEEVTQLDGELWVTLELPRPADTADGAFDSGQWGMWAAFLPDTAQNVWNASLGLVPPERRDTVWTQRLAPAIAARIVATIELALELDGGASSTSVLVEPTLVSTWAPDQNLLVSLQPQLGPGVLRSRITGLTVSLGATLPLGAKFLVRTASIHYRTDHLSHDLVNDAAVDEETGAELEAHIPVRLDRTEMRNPRQEDTTLATKLLAHLNERMEYYHQAIWRAMDANRRYLLLDGFLAPNAGGRSVASVVENRLIGIVGNCLVLPVVPGTHLDPQWHSSKEERASLRDLYTVDPPPPRRISVPTKGIYAEAVPGACNSCEKKDDTRFWRWEESPNPDQPTAIQAISTGSRRTTPAGTSADAFPTPIVGYQQVPSAPDPTGLAAALKLIGTPNLFRDLTGLDLTQQAAAQAFSSALDTAQFFGTQGAGLAQQRFQNQTMDRNLKRIKNARDQGLISADQANSLTRTALQSSAGAASANDPPPSSSPAVRRAIDRAASSPNGSVTVTRPSGTVSVTSGDRSASGPLSFDVDPPLVAIAQPSPNTCWAAAGAMLTSWLHRTSLTVTAAADQLGGGWRAKLDADYPLSSAEVVSYTGALGLVAEPPMDYLPRGILRLLQQHGPLLVIGDDAIDGDHLVHAHIVVGLRGDGSSDGTTVRYADPVDGGTHEESFTTFLNEIDASDVVATNLGVMHF